jgi:hypothetical protein
MGRRLTERGSIRRPSSIEGYPTSMLGRQRLATPMSVTISRFARLTIPKSSNRNRTEYSAIAASDCAHSALLGMSTIRRDHPNASGIGRKLTDSLKNRARHPLQ